MPSRLLPFDTGDGKTFDLVPISGDLHVPAELRQELARKALVCAHLLEYAENNPIPRRDDLAQLAASWPALYVQSVTGSYHFAFVADLLAKTEFGRRSESSLSKSMKQARQKFENVLPFMVPALKFWKLAEGLGELVDEDTATRLSEEPKIMRLRRVDDEL